ncbi:MAG TPA: aliphatic sulfonates ABC transporter substrate-binding protein, partial [Pelotomaculum sp.]|nr:aliphatic sulfonates ABC transporter substrate-binding protein [Pelotomaculum sp.]
MKKAFYAVLLLTLTVFLAAGCGKGANSQGETSQVPGVQAGEIRVATQPTPNIAPIFVAKQKGWLEEEMAKVGVTVKWTSFQAGPPMNESFAAGEQDVGFLGDTAAIIPKSAGQDMRVVSMAATAPNALAIVVPKNSQITSPQELKGKKVATVKGSYAHHLLTLVLQNNGLTTNDIQFINLTLADIGTALANGDIDAGGIWEPLITKLEDDGIARVLVDGTGIKKGSLVVVASNGFAVNNPELVKTFLKVYQRGYEFIKANP